MDKTNDQTKNQIIYLNSRNCKRVMGHSSSFRNINNHRFILLLCFEDCPISYVLPRMNVRESIEDLEDRTNPMVNIRIYINILK
ncbi:unnamed protein product, partial [Brassica oleracea]|uniref:(rape) hypothetical protein n=1 Tax=Brassica napus TaxID=3708 RepID=A0A816IIK5_BRANA|nr:unnamed protein product [Brassica napus]